MIASVYRWVSHAVPAGHPSLRHLAEHRACVFWLRHMQVLLSLLKVLLGMSPRCRQQAPSAGPNDIMTFSGTICVVPLPLPVTPPRRPPPSTSSPAAFKSLRLRSLETAARRVPKAVMEHAHRHVHVRTLTCACISTGRTVSAGSVNVPACVG
eukprot:353206-Chlamydomonas_euryale.AAC.16